VGDRRKGKESMGARKGRDRGKKISISERLREKREKIQEATDAAAKL